MYYMYGRKFSDDYFMQRALHNSQRSIHDLQNNCSKLESERMEYMRTAQKLDEEVTTLREDYRYNTLLDQYITSHYVMHIVNVVPSLRL